tara:strand:+ start:240 stop:620 length:381 start_codon:yes stop_codon:yes gene_type:complete
MAVTTTWKIDQLKIDPSDDNYIFEVVVNVFGTEGSVTKMVSTHCVFPGKKSDVTDFKTIDELKTEAGEAIVVQWVKDAFTEYKVNKLEAQVKDKIDEHNNIVKETTVNSSDTSYSAQPTQTPTPSE